MLCKSIKKLTSFMNSPLQIFFTNHGMKVGTDGNFCEYISIAFIIHYQYTNQPTTFDRYCLHVTIERVSLFY